MKLLIDEFLSKVLHIFTSMWSSLHPNLITDSYIVHIVQNKGHVCTLNQGEIQVKEKLWTVLNIS